MQLFGLISILAVILFGVSYVIKNTDSTLPWTEEESRGSYSDAIDSAKDVTNQAAPDKTDAEPMPTGKSITIYDGIDFKESTVTVDLSGRNLSGSLKGEIRFLTNLKELNLSGNNFTGLPAEIGQLSNLEVLNLANNPLTGLPQELGNLKNLKVLDLRGTQYAAQDLAGIKANLSSSVQILVD